MFGQLNLFLRLNLVFNIIGGEFSQKEFFVHIEGTPKTNIRQLHMDRRNSKQKLLVQIASFEILSNLYMIYQKMCASLWQCRTHALSFVILLSILCPSQILSWAARTLLRAHVHPGHLLQRFVQTPASASLVLHLTRWVENCLTWPDMLKDRKVRDIFRTC